ncbi:Uncharacterised protein [uncultured archaeon]|nr:Uncharacterised protein [uncultured archaeon]
MIGGDWISKLFLVNNMKFWIIALIALITLGGLVTAFHGFIFRPGIMNHMFNWTRGNFSNHSFNFTGMNFTKHGHRFNWMKGNYSGNFTFNFPKMKGFMNNTNVNYTRGFGSRMFGKYGMHRRMH